MKKRLIPDAYLWWRFWSNRFVVVGNAIAVFFLALPDSALYVWNALPQDLKSTLPPQYLPYIGIIISSLAVVARQLKQTKIERVKQNVKIKTIMDTTDNQH